MKLVSQLNHLGYFVGAVAADESPLEKGVFILPGGAIDIPPPEVPSGKAAIWREGRWVFVDPPEEPRPEAPQVDGVPAVVSRFQAKAALALAGHLETVEEIMADPDMPVLARLAWLDAQEFRRNSPTLLTLAERLGLDAEALDQLFITASEIQA